MPLACIRARYGKVIPISSWCDYMLIDQNGRSAFVDTKSIDDDKFKYSLINPDQLEFFTSVGDIVPAGYVVCFRKIHRVVYFPWTTLMALRPCESLKAADGIDLGPLAQFSVRKIFLARKPKL